MKPDLRFGSLFDKSWGFYTGEFRALMKVMFSFFGLPMLLILLIQLINQAFFPQNKFLYYGILIATSLLSILIYFIISIPVILYADAYLRTHRRLSMSSLSDKTGRIFSRFFWVELWTSLAVLGLFILLIIPGIIFCVYWAFFEYAAILDGQKTKGSWALSRKVVQGRWWKVLGTYLLFMLVFILPLFIFLFLPELLLNDPAHLLRDTALKGVITTLFYTVVYIPFSLTFFLIFYVRLKADSKIRH